MGAWLLLSQKLHDTHVVVAVDIRHRLLANSVVAAAVDAVEASREDFPAGTTMEMAAAVAGQLPTHRMPYLGSPYFAVPPKSLPRVDDLRWSNAVVVAVAVPTDRSRRIGWLPWLPNLTFPS